MRQNLKPLRDCGATAPLSRWLQAVKLSRKVSNLVT